MTTQVAAISSSASVSSSRGGNTYDEGDDDGTLGEGTYEGTLEDERTLGEETYEGSDSLTSSVQMRSEGETSTFDMSGTNSLTSSIQMRGENSTTATSASSFHRELSLPSSFASSDNDRDSVTGSDDLRAMVESFSEKSRSTQGGKDSGNDMNNADGTVAVYNRQTSRGGTTTTSRDDSSHSSVNTEDRLALRISKETKPMMHLLRLLNEMDVGNNNNNEHDPKGRARASLISDFEQEVSLIEHRIKDENLISNGEQPPLPPNWIALEDPDSGDIYYANEASGETQWERPGLIQDLQGSSDSMRNSQISNDLNGSGMQNNNSNQSNIYEGSAIHSHSNMSNTCEGSVQNQSNISNNYEGSVQNKSNLSNNYGGSSVPNSSNLSNNYEGGSAQNQSSQSNNYEGDMQNSNTSNNYEAGMRNSSTSNSYGGSGRGAGEGSVKSSTMSNTYQSSLTDSNDGNGLPPDWIALEDPDSGEKYYANEVTGESSWDKPSMPQSMPEEESVADTTSDTTGNDDDLPPDWIALEDADSGDTYYLNQVTMATTWDKPGKGDDNDTIDTPETNQNSEQASGNDEMTEVTNDDVLPPGWEPILDPSSGEYYYVHESGETQWDRPDFTESVSSGMDNSESQDTSLDSKGGDQSNDDSTDNDNLPPGWFAAVDEDSGDRYFCNEVTGETTWDFPTEPAVEDQSVLSEASQSQEGDENLPEGWFAVTDPGSGDPYFVHEESGETTWDRPTSQGATNSPNDHMVSNSSSNDNTVYGEDSTTTSEQF